MGIGFRVYIFEEKGSIIRIPFTKYEKLWDRDPEMAFPQYAGKKVRCALISVRLKDRKSVSTWKMDFHILNFNKKGRLDQKVLDEGSKLSMAALGRISSKGKKVIDIQYELALKEYHKNFSWTPSEAEINILKELALKK
jgi:hypothetical protein